jgi:PAS domain S-box-containing protein
VVAIAEARRHHVRPTAVSSPAGQPAQDRIAAIVETAGDATVIVDLDGVITGWSEPAERLYRHRADDVVGKQVGFLIPPERNGEEREVLAVVARGHRLERFETERVRGDGTRVKVTLTAAPLLDDAGTPVGAVVTARRSSDPAVVAADARLLASVVADSDDAVLSVSRTGAILSWNPAAERMFETPADRAIGRPLSEIVVSADDGDPDRWERVERAMAGGRAARHESTRRRSDGAELRQAIAVSPVVGPDGEVQAASIVCRDVTREHHADMYRARLAAIVESSSSIIVALDTRYRLTDLNGAARRMLGLGDGDIGRYLGDVVEPLRTAATPERREELLSVLDGASVSFDTFLRGTGGEVLMIDFELAPVRAADGTIIGISAIGRDVTGERRAEEQLRRLAAIVESSRDPILAARPDGTVVSINGAATEAFGVDEAHALGRPLAQVLPAWLADGGLGLGERIAHGDAIDDVEVSGVAADGSPTHHVVSVFPVRDEQGALSAGAVIVRDVTEAKRLAEQLGQMQRLESVGRLAGGIAHDFNNLMAVITGYAGLLARDVHGDPGAKAVDEIQRAARRAAELTAQLLAFSRRRPATRDTVDVTATVRGVRPMLERLLGADVELLVEAGEDVVTAVTDRAQLEQVVVNLAINARDAMPEGGMLRIGVEAVELGAADLRRRVGLMPGRYACITVRDTGSGIAPELLDTIFEPFFTTKEVGRGTGLGLASVHGTVTQAGGHVAVESRLGEGSAFRVYLPTAPPGATPAPGGGDEPTRAPAGGTETVLLCEDEDALRALLERTLTRAGYRVVAAPRAEEAVRLAHELDGVYDAVVTDVVMPGGSGLALAEELARRHGARPLLLISGFSAEAVDRGAGVTAAGAFLEKPFESAELLATLRSLLDDQASSA